MFHFHEGIFEGLPWHFHSVVFLVPVLPYGKSRLHCYERVMLCAVQDGCLIPMLPGVSVPFPLHLEMKVKATSLWSVSSCMPQKTCTSSRLVLRHLLMIT